MNVVLMVREWNIYLLVLVFSLQKYDHLIIVFNERDFKYKSVNKSKNNNFSKYTTKIGVIYYKNVLYFDL